MHKISKHLLIDKGHENINMELSSILPNKIVLIVQVFDFINISLKKIKRIHKYKKNLYIAN